MHLYTLVSFHTDVSTNNVTMEEPQMLLIHPSSVCLCLTKDILSQSELMERQVPIHNGREIHSKRSPGFVVEK